MLIRALTEHFLAYFSASAHHDTILWFDPDGEYTDLLEHLDAFDLWRYNKSLLEIRHRLINRDPGEQTIVYLPMPEKEAEILRPFFATSLIFQDRLYRFLRQQGLDFPDDPEVAHELRALLPRLAVRSVGKGRQFWEYNLANLERARETLLGNFDDALLRFLARPKSALSDMRQQKLDGLFFAQLESAYGFSASADDDPVDVARDLAAQLVLVQAFADTEDKGFPYAPRLPEPLHFENCRAFLDRWQRDSRYKHAYIRLADELEKRYDLAGWVQEIPLAEALTVAPTFCNVERALWERVRTQMADLVSEDDWHAWLTGHRPQFQTRADSFWAQEKRAPWWGLLVGAAHLLTAIHDTCQDLDRQATPKEMLQRYAEDWWRVDHDFRRLREALDTHALSLDRLRDRCTRSYRDALRRVNDRFAMLLETEGVWPPRGDSLPPQDHLWSDVMEEQKPDARVGVLLVDALRYELAQELLSTLNAQDTGDRRTLTARLAAIPTVTAIGMAALLPRGDDRKVDHDGEWNITIQDSGNLRDRRARRAWMERHLDDVQFYNLDVLLSTPADGIPEAAFTIVFDTTLDAVGETASKIAWNTFSSLLQSVKKGIYRLLELGIDQIHVMTDHGFLLLEKVGEHEKVSLRDVSALTKRSRYVVGRQLGHTEQLCFPVPGSSESDLLEAWFPRGVGCFRTPGPYNYVHGGLSLQELVVPHLQIEQQIMGRPVNVAAEFPNVIRNAQPDVRLRPVASGMFDRPRQVTLTLEKEGEAVLPPLSQVVEPTGPTKVSIFLPMGCGLQPGDQVRWTLRDAVTEEVLAEQDAVSQVDLW